MIVTAGLARLITENQESKHSLGLAEQVKKLIEPRRNHSLSNIFSSRGRSKKHEKISRVAHQSQSAQTIAKGIKRDQRKQCALKKKNSLQDEGSLPDNVSIRPSLRNFTCSFSQPMPTGKAAPKGSKAQSGLELAPIKAAATARPPSKTD